jgi:hypothetical protein
MGAFLQKCHCLWFWKESQVSDYDIEQMQRVDKLARGDSSQPLLDIIFEDFLYDHNIVSDPIPCRGRCSS